MAKSNSPKIYAGMLKTELLDVAHRLGLEGVSRLRKDDLLKMIQASLSRPKRRGTAKSGSKSSKEATKPKAATSTSKKTSTAKTAPKKTAPKKTDAKGTTPSKKKIAKEKPSKPVTKPKKASSPKRPARPSSPKPASSAMSDQSRVTAAKYGREQPFPVEDLRHIDAALPGLPEGYGQDRIVLLPRDPEWLYAYWDIRNETKDQARRQGGVNLAVRLYELDESRLEPMTEHWVQEYSRAWYLSVPSPGQTYVAEIGYRNGDGGWCPMLRSNAVNVPPAGPSPIVADQFVTITPDDPLEPSLSAKAKRARSAATPRAKAKRAKGARGSKGSKGGPHQAAYEASLGGTNTDAPSSAPSSIKVGPAWSASQRPAPIADDSERGFWLMAEAELVVFGATEPKASLSVGGQKIRLRDDGTFSIRMAFPDGTIELPIEAIAEDGEQRRRLSMRFERATGKVETLDNVR